MKRLFFIFCFTFQLIAYQGSAQPGNYFLSHYAPRDENIDYLSFDIAQTERGVIYFANKNGVVEFDGRNWNVIDTPGAIYTLAVANGNDIYLGGLTGFGKLSLTEENVMAFMPLTENAKNVFKCKALNDYIYFINDGHLYRFNIETQKIDLTIDARSSTSFTGLFEIGGNIYVDDSNSQLRQLQEDKLVPASFPLPENDELLFADKFSSASKYLMGMASSRIFIHDSGKITELEIKEFEYLQTNVVITGRWVNEDLIALGTLSGGIVFVNSKTGVTEEIISYYTGLPDNEVFSLMTDKNQGVWVAHDYGFTRIAPHLPFRTFNHYPGLSGNLLSAYSDNDNVYVGTSVGLFKLNKEEVYGEETYFVTKLRETTAAEKKEERRESRKGLFGFLKRKNNDDAKKEEEKATPQTKKGVKKVVEKKTRKVLEALDYAYKKVEGIDGKVTQLMHINNKVIAAGVGGVFEVKGLKSTQILEMPVRTVFYSPSLSQLLVSTYNDRIRTLKSNSNGWEETFLLDTVRAYVGNIFEDHIQNIWLCGRADVIKVELLNGKVSTMSSVPFATPVLDETMGFTLGTDVFVAATGAFHRYDAIKHEFSKYDSLPGPRKYFTSIGTFWFNDGHRWRTVDRKLQNSLKLEWLGLFPNIRTLTTANNGEGLWLITSDNELYKFTKSDLQELAMKYPLFLREVREQGSKLSPGKLYTIDQRESALSFEFIQPEYTNALAIEYQYMIVGIGSDWSEWSSTNNVVNFPLLTPGKYELRIKSRDLFGQISELKSIDFRVVPPYWRQTWFYGLEFVFFAMLVFLSLKLGAGNSRYRNISRLLSILTIIMFIQLAQNTVESFINVQTTPVIDFFIQVFVALLILPLENKMRGFMVEASEGKFDLKRLKRVKE